MGYRTYQTEIAPPFLRDATADAWHRACGDVKDEEIDRLKRAVKARMPLLARPDAVAEIGAERGVERLPGESDAAYAQRVTHAWESWQWAGTPYGVLVALADLGYADAVLVVPNGKSYRLAAGELVVGELPAGSWSIAAAGWARFDVVLPSNPFPMVIGPMTHTGTGDAGDVYGASGTPTGAFDVVIGVVAGGSIEDVLIRVSVDGGTSWGGNVSVPAGAALIDDLGISETTGISVTFLEAAMFVTGDRWAFSSSAFPATTAASIEGIRRAIAKWRPGHAVPSRMVVIDSGESWGWPLGTWGDAGIWTADCAVYDL